MAHEIKVVNEPRRLTAETRFEGRPEDFPPKFQQAFGQVAGYLGARGVPFDGPAFAWYHPRPDGSFEVRAGFYVGREFAPADGVAFGELPQAEAAVTTHIGSYESLHEAYEDIQRWAGESGRLLGEVMWEEYLDGPEVPPEKTRTRVVWPLA
jgi:effector-binding domain-containing protein